MLPDVKRVRMLVWYVKHCKIKAKQQLELIKFLLQETTARAVADLVCVYRNSAIRFFHKLREKIALKQQNLSEQFAGR
jgi:transposase